MTKQQDDSVPPRDIREQLPPADRLTVGELVRLATFPVYGLLEHPHGLVLKGIGHTTIPFRWDTPIDTDPPHVLLQVWLTYDYPPSHGRSGRRFDLVTTDATRPPLSSGADANLTDAAMPRYRSHLDVSLDLTKAARFAIEGFSIVGSFVELLVKYWPLSSASQIAQLAAPEWSFTLKGLDIAIEGAANGWTPTEIFDILGHVAAISERSDVLAEHQQEMTNWKGQYGRHTI